MGSLDDLTSGGSIRVARPLPNAASPAFEALKG
jgi:hypothetical protein